MVETTIRVMKSVGAFVLKTRQLKNLIYTLYLASKDPRIPLYVKILMLLIIAYALSPVDLVPDFVPLLGYIDDIIILPLGIYLVFKLIPEEIKAEYREKAESQVPGSNLKWVGLAMIILVWLLIAFWIIAVFWL
ncbi:MAG TPA: DUF1232 domain-containing protein [Dehalococcoidia bacterium]|nr:DUF1232 domain-containing protein [Dehalococcoidia bacterium]